MTWADGLLIFVVVAGFVAIGAFISVAFASDQRDGRYPGTKLDLLRDCIVMNAPALPFLGLVLIIYLSGVEDGEGYGVMWVLWAGFTSACHFLPPVKRARQRFDKAYGGRAPYQ